MGLFQHLVTQANRGGAALLRGRREGEETEQRRRLLEDENARRNELLKQQAGMMALQNFMLRREARGPSLRDRWAAERAEQREEQTHESEMEARAALTAERKANAGRLGRLPAPGTATARPASLRTNRVQAEAELRANARRPHWNEALSRLWIQSHYPGAFLQSEIDEMVRGARRPRAAGGSVLDSLRASVRR